VSPTRESRRELALVACALLLPIPLLAATGLGVPLPGTVERGLASLVPFAPPVTDGDVAPSPAAPRSPDASSSVFARGSAAAARKPEPPRTTPSTAVPRTNPAPSDAGGGSGTFENLPAPDDSPAPVPPPPAPTPSAPAPETGEPPAPIAAAVEGPTVSVEVDDEGGKLEVVVDPPLDLPPVEAEVPLPAVPGLPLPAPSLPLP
jgi:hypothetical protein